MAAGLQMYVVEAFTAGNNQPFTGNTAGVCILKYDDDISDELKQKIAFQMNLSETAFITQGWTKAKPLNSHTSNRWTLRWLTPTLEVELCGHATLAAANVIFNEILKKHSLITSAEKETTLIFESKFKGELQATINWESGRIALNFPSNPTIPITTAEIDSEDWINDMLAETLGPNLPTNAVNDIQYAPGLTYILFRLRNTGTPEGNLELLEKVKPNFKNLLTINTGKHKMHSVMVTIEGWSPDRLEKPQFFSRFFAPWCGVDEDPVTGSAHTVLAPYWFQEWKKQGIQFKTDSTLLARQMSQRTGDVVCSMRDNGERVNLIGQSRLTLQGEFYPS